jgi:hypothetical protein
MTRIRHLGLLAILCLVAAGCSGAPDGALVCGSVTLDGQPLDDGTIRFVPKDGQSTTAGGVVKNGNFELTLPIADYRVEIVSTKILGGAGKASKHDLSSNPTVIQRIPDKYNTKSQLVLEAKAGVHQPQFELLSRSYGTE